MTRTTEDYQDNFALPRAALEAEPVLSSPRAAPGRSFHRLNLPATHLRQHQTSATIFTFVKMSCEWNDKKTTYVIARCEVNESLVVGCQQTLSNTSTNTFHVTQNNSTLCVTFRTDNACVLCTTCIFCRP